MGQMSFLGTHAYRPWPGGSSPAVHQEQLNTAYVGAQWRKQAVKEKLIHMQATLKDRGDGGK